jgi:serine/threonine-protein kinase
MLRPGERVGDWIIEAPLGEGGMGAVYRVHSALTDRLVAALKVMKPTAEADARARFVREAEALSALRHPAVVRVMGFSEDRERELLYLVMELAVGETLRQRIARGAMDLSEALATFVPLAQGLDHAHARGIFHRDLKPSNVVLTVDGTPRLVDFGIAAALHAEPLTTGEHLGTLPYLPPEVFRGERADPAAIDVYAFGLLLHEALTGLRSFAAEPGSTPAAAAAAIGVRKLQAPSVELPGHFPPRVREMVRRATDADPKARPTMHALRQGLESAVERRAAGAAPGRFTPSPAPPPVSDEKTTRVPDPTGVPIAGGIAEAVGLTGSRGVGRRRGDRTRVRLLTAAAIAAALLALALILNARRPDAEPVAAGASRQPAGSVARPSARPPAPRRGPAASPAAALPAADATRADARDDSPPAEERASAATPTPAPTAAASAARRPPPGDETPTTAAARAPPPAGPAERIEDPPDAPAASGEVSELGGRWALSHQVEASDYGPYQGLRLGYEVTLVQEGNRIYGQGQKVSENGTRLPAAQRTPIDVAGRVEDGQVVLYFTEIGANRTSRGTIRWRLAPVDGSLEGRFASDAANSSGVSQGRRLP